jgi:hypothetical protein
VKEWIAVLVILAGWLVMMLVVWPKLGVPT